MVKKMIAAVVIAVVAGMVGTGVAFAAEQADAYITVRCTATISVTLFSGGGYDAVTSYNFGDVSAAGVYVSTQPIGVQNNSIGAICRWDLQIANINNGTGTPWTVGATPSLNRMAMYAKMSTNTLTSSDFNVTVDTLAYTSDKQYNGTNFYAACVDYTSPALSWTDETKVLPATIGALIAQRHMWIRFDAPQAVSDQEQRTITVRITASMAN